MPLPPLGLGPDRLHVQAGGVCLPHWDADWPHVCMAEASPLGAAWEGFLFSAPTNIQSCIF